MIRSEGYLITSHAVRRVWRGIAPKPIFPKEVMWYHGVS
jgi:hypothetical protein